MDTFERNTMINIQHAFRSDRVLKALTGLSKQEFTALIVSFEQTLQKQASRRRKPRKRKPGAGRKPVLSSIQDKLFFILFYVKCYPTFDVAGVLFEVHRSQPHRWVHTLLPVLEKTLGEEVVLPVRKIDQVEAFFTRFPQVKNLFIDGTERPTQRPKDPDTQNGYRPD